MVEVKWKREERAPLGPENVLHLDLVVIYLISINTKYLVLILGLNP